MELTGLVLIYLLKGKLPWQGLHAETKKDKYLKIKQVKLDTLIEHCAQESPMNLLPTSLMPALFILRRLPTIPTVKFCSDMEAFIKSTT